MLIFKYLFLTIFQVNFYITHHEKLQENRVKCSEKKIIVISVLSYRYDFQLGTCYIEQGGVLGLELASCECSSIPERLRILLISILSESTKKLLCWLQN